MRDASAPPQRNVERMIYSPGIAGSAASAPKHELHKALLARVAMLVKVRAPIELFLTKVSANKGDPETRKDRGRPIFTCLPRMQSKKFC